MPTPSCPDNERSGRLDVEVVRDAPEAEAARVDQFDVQRVESALCRSERHPRRAVRSGRYLRHVLAERIAEGSGDVAQVTGVEHELARNSHAADGLDPLGIGLR